MPKSIALSFRTAVFTGVLAFSSSHAFALPTVKSQINARRWGPAATAEDAGSYSFEGIVALDDCSGSLVRFPSSADTDPAMVLTNGHCLESGFPPAGEVVIGQGSSRSFSLLGAEGSVSGKLTATQILYSTMTDTDITLYRTQETYADILSRYGIRPFDLSAVHPQAGAAIQVISGYWQRGYRCSIEAFVHELREGPWTWKDSIRYSETGCDVVGGTSGSPILLVGTRTVIGINNTINEEGERCTLDNPCEVDARGNVTYQQGEGYGQETYWISTCVDSSRELDLTVAGCLLPRPAKSGTPQPRLQIEVMTEIFTKLPDASTAEDDEKRTELLLSPANPLSCRKKEG